jgi:PAS domain S-box-containing protein
MCSGIPHLKDLRILFTSVLRIQLPIPVTMLSSFQDKLKTQELRNLRYLTVFSALIVTALGFLFEFLYHDGWILFTGLIVSMGLTINFLLSYYNTFFRIHFSRITDLTIVLLHVWAVFVAYQRDFEIVVLLPVAISIFTFALIYDRFIKSVLFIFLLTTLMLSLMLLKKGWEPQNTVAIITLYSGAILSNQIQQRKKQFQREIQSQENRFAALVEHMNDGLIYADANWKIMSVSEQFCRMSGYTTTELTGTDLRNIISMQEREAPSFSFFEELDHDKVARTELMLRAKSGEVLTARINGAPYFDVQGNRNGSMIVFTDISSLKYTQDLLKKREEGYRTFIDQSAIGIWRTDYLEPIPVNLPVDQQIKLLLETGIITECNDFMARMYGYAGSHELIGMSLKDFYHVETTQDRQKVEDMLSDFVTNQYRISNAESMERDRKGNQRFMLNNNIGIVENGRLIRTWRVQADITERKKTERELREAYRELDTFFYKASHDLKGPIASMLGIVHLGQMDNPDPQIARYFEMIESSATRLDQTLMELIELARTRKGASKISEIRLKPFIATVLKGLEHLPRFHKINFTLDVPDDSLLFTDRVLLQSVLKNLIHNAIVYSNRISPAITLCAKEHYESIELEVMDNGEGIPESIQPHIFDMFYRGHQDSSGSGLGLFVVKNALEKMKGNIRFETASGKGTVFHLTFPKRLTE